MGEIDGPRIRAPGRPGLRRTAAPGAGRDPAATGLAARGLAAIDLTDVPVRAAGVADLPAAGGGHLPADVRTRLRRTTGREPAPDVTVHTDPLSRAVADRLHARALTHDRHIRLGSAGSLDDTDHLVHEGVHALQQCAGPSSGTVVAAPSSQAEAEAARVVDAGRPGLVAPVTAAPTGEGIHLATVDEVREKLSYGVFDWAITDNDALEALALLATVPAAELPAQLAMLGDSYVARLLDNLPDAAKTGPFYQQLVQASSESGVVAHATGLLSRGLFDWAVTDTEVEQFFNVFSNRTPAQREELLTDLDTAGRLDTLVANSTAGHHTLYLRPWMATLTRGAVTKAQRRILRTIMGEDVPIETARLATELRFDVSLTAPTAADPESREWTTDSLRATYLGLDPLPDAHVRNNAMFLHLRQFDRAPKVEPNRTSTVAGQFKDEDKQLSVNIQAKDVGDVVVHETGHAVDAALEWRKKEGVRRSGSGRLDGVPECGRLRVRHDHRVGRRHLRPRRGQAGQRAHRHDHRDGAPRRRLAHGDGGRLPLVRGPARAGAQRGAFGRRAGGRAGRAEAAVAQPR